jgi:two-component system NtrC family sensor kinase
MDLFQLLMVGLALFMALPEYRRSNREEYLYLICGLAILVIHLITRVLLNGSYDYAFALQLPSVDLLGSFFNGVGLVLITYFFSIAVMADYKSPLRWGRVFLLGIIGVTALFMLLQFFGMFQSPQDWAIVGRPALRLAVLIIIGAAIAQITSGIKRSNQTLVAFICLAIAHFYHLFDYTSDQGTGLLSSMYPWPYVFNPIGYLFIVSSVFKKITDDQMLLSEQLQRRGKELETATSNLSRLNHLSTNLLRTTELKGIVRMILDSLQIDLGFKNSALFILEKETASLRGYKISQLTGAPVSYPKISILKKIFIVDCFLQGKSNIFGEGHSPANASFVRDFDFSAQITTIPLLTKKETDCFDAKGCTNKNCPVKSWDLNICWQMTDQKCPCSNPDESAKLETCLVCPAFNLVGLMVLDNRNARVKADESSIPFFETFANQAGMALQNAFLVEDLSKEATLRTETLTNLPVGIIVLDTLGKIREFNQAMEQISQIRIEQTANRHYSEIRIVDDTKSLNEKISGILQGTISGIDGEILSHTLSIGAGHRILNVRLRPIMKNLRLNGLIIMVEDITEMKELEKQLIRSESLASMGQLAMGIAHEINNPIAGVSGVLQVLESRFEENSSERKALVTAQKDLKRASGIIKDLLTFAKQKAPEKKLMDINSIVVESGDFIPYQPGGENVTIIRDLDANLPLISVDPDQIHQVVTNLILNSISAMKEKGGSEAIIEFTTWFDRKWLYIQIQDNGTGIEKKNLKKIFDPFFTTKKSGKGTGLGLSLCDRIITDHCGIITVRSEPGQGAAFLIKLPRRSDSL